MKDRAATLRFGRDRRILNRREFQAVYQGGRKAGGKYAVVFCLRHGEGDDTRPFRLGLTATRKVGGSVQRNRQRRRIRELFRTHQWNLPHGWDFVVNTKVGAESASREELKSDLDKCLARLGFRAGSTDERC